jgi:hypothetical protein
MLRALRWMPSLPPGIANRAPSAATLARDRELHPRAHRGAVDGGDHRRRIGDDRVEHLLERGPERVLARVVEAGDEVGAGAERRALAGDDDGAQVRVLGELRAQRVAELAVQCVAPLLAVDDDEADRAPRLEPDVRRDVRLRR